MPITLNCLCPLDSKIQSLGKINNNLVILFEAMSSAFTGIQVNTGACGCTELQILQTINRNLVAAFEAITASSLVQAGVEDLAQNDVSKAITFPAAFAAAPSVVPVIVAPDNSGYVIDCVLDESTRTTIGVTVLFAAAIPGAGYKMSWVAAEET